MTDAGETRASEERDAQLAVWVQMRAMREAVLPLPADWERLAHDEYVRAAAELGAAINAGGFPVPESIRHRTAAALGAWRRAYAALPPGVPPGSGEVPFADPGPCPCPLCGEDWPYDDAAHEAVQEGMHER